MYRTVLIILFFFGQVAIAQPQCGALACKGYATRNTAARTTIADAREDAYDISYLHFDLHLSDTTAYISGSLTTTARVTAGNMSAYVFELADTMIIDSVHMNGTRASFVFADGICSVPALLPQGSVFTAQVYYHGYPRGAGDINYPGFHNQDGITFSLVEPYFSHTWWPCKQSLTDKIDSVDMWVTVPTGVKVGSNGALQTITPIDPMHERYEWKERFPIDHYLISVAVSRYTEHSYYMHFSGSTDSMLIMNYVPDSMLAYARPLLDSAGMFVDHFSTLFGRYPFWKEKYGHCYTPSFVNMEHQTMTSTRLSRLTVIAHELTHQWFGDNVTCGSWRDIWLNEGFAAYGQYIGYDHFNAAKAGAEYIDAMHTSVWSNDCGSVYVDDTVNWQRIFDTRLTYDKGGSVVHMLRFMINDDSLFFKILRTYQQRFAGRTAIIKDLRAVAEELSGMELDTFFRQWIYGEGFPYYEATWNQANDMVYVSMAQHASCPHATPLFEMPVEIKLYSSLGDTVVRVYNNRAMQIFRIPMSRPIDSIVIDPAHWLLYKATRDVVKDARFIPDAIVYPNPVSSILTIEYKDLANAQFLLYDAAGKRVMSRSWTHSPGIETIDVHELPVGMYIYRITSNGAIKAEGKVIRE